MPRDEKQGFELARQAADRGHADAIAMLGYCYSVGMAVARDDAEARRLFSQATEKGSTAGQVNLGLFLVRGRGGERDTAGGVALLRKAAASGNQQAAVLLGEIFYFGEHADGTPDFAEAHKVLLGPAEAGQAAAQNMVGVILKDGRSGQKDELEARIWFEKSAIQGNGKACFNLGQLLWNHGSADRWSRIEALRWLIVGDALDEATAFNFLEDIKPGIDREDVEGARRLAIISLNSLPKGIKVRHPEKE